MNLLDAIASRTSCRKFLPQPLTVVQREQLRKAVEQCNSRAGLAVKLVCDDREAFSAFPKAGGRIQGGCNYFLMAGPAEDCDLEEKCGYYGEELVLTAECMGLRTCWVGGTYDRNACLRFLTDDEELVCVIAVGIPDQGQLEKERARKSLDELAAGWEDAPEWFRKGAEAMRLAPSAMNRQGYSLTFRRDGTAKVRLSGSGSFALADLGIAKRHFELGAHGGEWSWGDGGVFRKAKEEKSCGAVVWRNMDGERQYLLVRHNRGHWSFPKGHVEGQETEPETAAREIWEETGLSAEIDTGFRHVVTYAPKPGTVKDVVFFTAVPSGGTEHPQESEISQLGWFGFQEAARQVTYATDEDILMAAEAYLNT